MKKEAACGFFIFLFDLVLVLVTWMGLVILKCPFFDHLALVWVFGLVKWAILQTFTSILTAGKADTVYCRLVALLCLLSPVYETGRFLLASSTEAYKGPTPDVSMLLLGSTSCFLACLIWEQGFCGSSRKAANKENAWELLLRVVEYFKPDTHYLTPAFGFLILGVFCDTYIPLYQGQVIDMLRGEQLHSSFGFAIGRLALICFGSALFSGLRGGLFMFSLNRLNKRLMHLLFHTFLQQEVNFFDENKPGELSSRLRKDVDLMGRTVALNANVVVRSAVRTCLMFRLMLGLSWELTLLTCLEMPFLAIMQNKYTAISKELKDQLQDCQAKIEELATETLRGIRTVRSHRGEKEELRRYKEAVDQMSSIKRWSGFYRAVFLIIRRLVSLGINVLMLVQAHHLISTGQLSVGSLVSFFLYQKPMTTNLREILSGYGGIVSTVGVIAKVVGYLDRTPKCKKAGDLAPEKLQGRIDFQNVTFSYPSSPNTAVLKSVSMQLQPGTITALVGRSGSGKSSCVSLLKRLYEPQEGQILLDGQPLHQYDHQYFHNKVAVVSQDLALFSGSLRSNIEYGLNDCSFDKVTEAARKSAAHDFITELENEYDTDIGESGSRLSEGLKQCIAISRALVRDPQVLILDEATSKLDVEIQHAVLREIVSCGWTVLMVAHDLKTVEEAHHIIYMENGTVAEEGTHEQLMAKTGRYYRSKMFCE